MAQWHKRVTVKAEVVRSIPIRGSELFNTFNFSHRSNIATPDCKRRYEENDLFLFSRSDYKTKHSAIHMQCLEKKGVK